VQAERDRYFQAKMGQERTLSGNSYQSRLKGMSNAKRLEFGFQRATGPAKGVLTELRRIDPSGTRQISAVLETRCDALGWRLEHLGVTIGTVIHGPDLSQELSDEQVGAMKAVLLERKVIFFREQNLSYEAHKNFGLRFGSLEVFPFATPPIEEAPEVLPIRSGPGSATAASNWHSGA
jgi:hypothetical protein